MAERGDKGNPSAGCGRRIELCEDGYYRWDYELSLFRNPVVLIAVAKVLGGTFAGVCAFIFAISLLPDLVSGRAGAAEAMEFGGIWLAVAAVMAAITLIGYAIYAVIHGGRYRVRFEMDEHGIEHRQLPLDFRKSNAISALDVAAGMASGNPTVAGIGMSSSRDSLYTEFGRVTSVVASRPRNVIMLNEPFARNQVYVADEDFDFAVDFICRQCPDAKTRLSSSVGKTRRFSS